MPPSKPKRRRGGASSRGRKKHRRLDTIHDVAPAPPRRPRVATPTRRRAAGARGCAALRYCSTPRRSLRRADHGGVGSSGATRRGSKGRSRDEADGREMEEDEDDDGEMWYGARGCGMNNADDLFNA
jgi:hypothetical protein